MEEHAGFALASLFKKNRGRVPLLKGTEGWFLVYDVIKDEKRWHGMLKLNKMIPLFDIGFLC